MKNDELEKLLKLNVDDISPDPMTAEEKEQLKRAVLAYQPQKKKKKNRAVWGAVMFAALVLFCARHSFSSTIAMAAYQLPF